MILRKAVAKSFSLIGYTIFFVAFMTPCVLSALSARSMIMKKQYIPKNLMVTGAVMSAVIYATLLSLIIFSISGKLSSEQETTPSKEDISACDILLPTIVSAMLVMSILSAYYLHVRDNSAINKLLISTFIVNAILPLILFGGIFIFACIVVVILRSQIHQSADQANANEDQGHANDMRSLLENLGVIENPTREYIKDVFNKITHGKTLSENKKKEILEQITAGTVSFFHKISLEIGFSLSLPSYAESHEIVGASSAFTANQGRSDLPPPYSQQTEMTFNPPKGVRDDLQSPHH